MDGDPLNISRRRFTYVGMASLLSIDGVGQLQMSGPSGNEPVDEYEFQGVADLMGPADARPTPGSEFFDNKVFYWYRYHEEETGLEWFISQDDDAWAEIPTSLHTYATADLPTPPNSGRLAFDTDRGIPAWWDRDHWEWPTFVDNQDVETSDEVVTDTTVETELLRFGTNPGGLPQGRVLVLRNFGVYDTAASTDSFTYRVYLGEMGFDPVAGEGSMVTQVSTVMENVTDGPWSGKSTIIVDQTGTSGVVDVHTEARFNDTPNDDHSRDVSVDADTAESIVATLQWNNAKVDNEARQDMAYLQQQA